AGRAMDSMPRARIVAEPQPSLAERMGILEARLDEMTRRAELAESLADARLHDLERVVPKEFELFRYLMDHAGEVVTREMLLRHVWKLSFDPQTNVVDVNVGRLRRKLEEGFDTPVLETVWGTGYRLIARADPARG
ncbi:MAG: winged helix-turn-helix domain-containing protein, partial [Pseudomonadota bacterium]|nr:winged helix-turn-helix domain-containing protein [Pseudomonadota bacterium]